MLGIEILDETAAKRATIARAWAEVNRTNSMPPV